MLSAWSKSGSKGSMISSNESRLSASPSQSSAVCSCRALRSGSADQCGSVRSSALTVTTFARPFSVTLRRLLFLVCHLVRLNASETANKKYDSPDARLCTHHPQNCSTPRPTSARRYVICICVTRRPLGLDRRVRAGRYGKVNCRVELMVEVMQ